MDLSEVCKRINELTNKFPNLNKEEVVELRDLCGNLRNECEDALYDWGK